MSEQELWELHFRSLLRDFPGMGAERAGQQADKAVVCWKLRWSKETPGPLTEEPGAGEEE